jgi:hypothetical protein
MAAGQGCQLSSHLCNESGCDFWAPGCHVSHVRTRSKIIRVGRACSNRASSASAAASAAAAAAAGGGPFPLALLARVMRLSEG